MEKEEKIKIYNIVEEIKDYQKEIARLKEINKKHQELNGKLQVKISKAIEYIENNRYTNNEFDMVDIINYEDFDVVEVEDLLEILKDVSNE